MRIAMIGHKRITAFEGGIEKTVYQLSEYMTKKGHQVTVYDRGCRYKAAASRQDLKQPEGVRIIHVPAVCGAAEVPVYSFLAAVHAAFGKYDLVIFHASGPSLMLPIVKLFRKKTIAFIHGIDSQRSKWGTFARAYLRAGERTAARFADEVLVLSESNKKYFEEKYQRTPRIVSNGVAIPVIVRNEEVILKKHGLKTNEYILFSGRVSKEKGLQYLIPAYLKINPDKKLVIAGTADLKHRDFFESLMDMCRGNEKIIFTGNLPQDELTVLYRNAAVFVLPSEIEGMPHSLLEALACKAACLLSDIPENMEVAGKHAVYFRSKDTADLQRRLQYMLDHLEELAEITDSEDTDVLEKYDLKKSSERILKICRQVADK